MPTYEPYKGKEADLQKATAKWIRLAYPNLLAFHVPNGGLRPVTTLVRRDGLKQVNLVGADLKRQGVMNGVPDWVILHPAQGYHGLFIELKNAAGTLTDAQKAFITQATSAGYCCKVARSLQEFMDIVNEYFL
jgi:hypothetical protein